MTTISKINVHLLCSLMQEYGIRHVVVSSGSRCAPISVALSRKGTFTLHPVIDERSAAFIALGIALTVNEPVAMVCTSGSAPLNYAPALAEAYYRRVPLVAISADRPARCIGQRAGQTIRQYGALDSITRLSVDIPDISDDHDAIRHANRLINDALTACTGRISGPVHINLQLEVPLTDMCDEAMLPKARKTETLFVPESTDKTVLPSWPIKHPRILLAIGGVRLATEDLKALRTLRESGDVAVIAEAQSNIPDSIRPMHCDRVIEEAPEPNIVAFIGGDFISNRFKTWLGSLDNCAFISGGFEDGVVSPFQHLDLHIDGSPAALFRMLTPDYTGGTYSKMWQHLAKRGLKEYNTASPAVKIFRALAEKFDGNLVHISNGSSARIAQLVDWGKDTIIEINRGVSGIDGSTSTAIGAAMVNKGPVLLISGDMSAAYDIGALATINLPANFRMAVLDNEGGDIFRNIPTTRKLPELDRLFVMKPVLPLAQLAGAYGLGYYECSSDTDKNIENFFHHNGPALLRIVVKPEDMAGLI